MYIIRTQQFVGTEIYIKSCSKRAVSKNAEVKINGKNGEHLIILNVPHLRGKIKLQRAGAKKAPFYHIVVADSRSPRDGRIVEKIGTYDPMTNPATINLDKEKIATWIKNGAKPTDTVKALIEKAQ